MNRVARPLVWDFALAAVLALRWLLHEVWVPLPSVLGEGSRSVSTAVALLACAALSQRRSHPLAAALVVLLGWPIAYLVTPVLVLFWGQFVPIVVALYSVARYGDPRQRGDRRAWPVRERCCSSNSGCPCWGTRARSSSTGWSAWSAFGLGWFVHSHEQRGGQAEAARAVRAEEDAAGSRSGWPWPTNAPGSRASCTTSWRTG